jgi:hypothetical protein
LCQLEDLTEVVVCNANPGRGQIDFLARDEARRSLRRLD